MYTCASCRTLLLYIGYHFLAPPCHILPSPPFLPHPSALIFPPARDMIYFECEFSISISFHTHAHTHNACILTRTCTQHTHTMCLPYTIAHHSAHTHMHVCTHTHMHVYCTCMHIPLYTYPCELYRYPTGEWNIMGEFNANNERVLQSFVPKESAYAKFVKVSRMHAVWQHPLLVGFHWEWWRWGIYLYLLVLLRHPIKPHYCTRTVPCIFVPLS